MVWSMGLVWWNCLMWWQDKVEMHGSQMSDFKSNVRFTTKITQVQINLEPVSQAKTNFFVLIMEPRESFDQLIYFFIFFKQCLLGLYLPGCLLADWNAFSGSTGRLWTRQKYTRITWENEELCSVHWKWHVLTLAADICEWHYIVCFFFYIRGRWEEEEEALTSAAQIFPFHLFFLSSNLDWCRKIFNLKAFPLNLLAFHNLYYCTPKHFYYCLQSKHRTDCINVWHGGDG